MNSEERHHLKTNDLGQAVKAVGYRLEEHATKIVVAICAILIVAAAVIWWSRQTNSKTAQAWTSLEGAQTLGDFGEVAEKFPGTRAAQWAKLRESELNLQTGMSAMFQDREVALADLKKAQQGFEQLASGKTGDPIIRERALWGLALVLESTSDVDTSKASDAYQNLLKEFPETFYKPLAEQRITALKSGDTKAFYAWFSKQNPKPAEVRPSDGKNPFDSLTPPDGKSEFNLNPSKTDGASKPDAAPVVTPADAGSPKADAIPELKSEADAGKKDAEKNDAEKKDAVKEETGKKE